MLKFDWHLSKEPLSTTEFRSAPTKGLNKKTADIALEKDSIENRDFADVNSKVSAIALGLTKTVAEMRDLIWDGTPPQHRA